MNRHYLLRILLILLLPQLAFGQVIHFNTASDTNLIDADRAWKYHAGDDTLWKNPGFNDSGWDTLKTNLNLNKVDTSVFNGIGWFRYHLKIDSMFVNKPMAFLMEHMGASEIYLDGQLVHSFGKVSPGKEKEEAYNPQHMPVNIVFDSAGNYVLAVRYSNHHAFENLKKHDEETAGFEMELVEANDAAEQYANKILIITALYLSLFGIFITLFLLHLVLFLFYQREKSNLYYSLFTGSLAVLFFMLFLGSVSNTPSHINLYNRIGNFSGVFMFTALLTLVYSIVYERMPKRFWIAMALAAVYIPLMFIEYKWADRLFTLLAVAVIADVLRVMFLTFIRRYDQKKKIRKGVLYAVLAIIAIAVVGGFIDSDIPMVILAGVAVLVATGLVGSIFIVPIFMSFRHARNFSKTNRNLLEQLEQVKELSAKTLRQEQEKKKIIESQKEELEKQVIQRTAEVVEQKREIEEKNKDITDSINYARRIQEAILPPESLIYEVASESFIIYLPKDIVSGDFYFLSQGTREKRQGKDNEPVGQLTNQQIILAAADCTGHGVPGALMSMIGHNFLSQIITEKKITAPADILNELDLGIRSALNQNNTNGLQPQDGMDIALCNINIKEKILQFAGAQRPLYLIRDNRLIETKGDKFSIGGLSGEHRKSFTNHTVLLHENDIIYIFSDGFADQFGGPQGKKFMTGRFKNLLLSIQAEPMARQKEIILETLSNWKDKKEQVDDILVIGVKVV